MSIYSKCTITYMLVLLAIGQSYLLYKISCWQKPFDQVIADIDKAPNRYDHKESLYNPKKIRLEAQYQNLLSLQRQVKNNDISVQMFIENIINSNNLLEYVPSVTLRYLEPISRKDHKRKIFSELMLHIQTNVPSGYDNSNRFDTYVNMEPINRDSLELQFSIVERLSDHSNNFYLFDGKERSMLTKLPAHYTGPLDKLELFYINRSTNKESRYAYQSKK